MEAKDYTIQGGSEEISVYNLKLTEEIVAKLQKGQKNLEDLVGVEFVLSNSDKEINKLKIGGTTFQFTKVKETQAIHLLSNLKGSNKLVHLGSVNEKLNPKLELEASKAEAIRHRSQEAEKERLSRKTVELDSSSLKDGKSMNHHHHHQSKRLINRRPSVTRSTTTTTPSTTPVKSNNNNPNYSLRTRSIQILALGPKSHDQLLLKLNTNSNFLAPILQDICLNPSNTAALSLRPQVFKEVKVVDWPFYSMRERDLVSRNISLNSPSSSSEAATPPETPETPSPKKQTFSSKLTSSSFPSVGQNSAAASTSNSRSVPNSAKKTVTAKDRLSAILKRRR